MACNVSSHSDILGSVGMGLSPALSQGRRAGLRAANGEDRHGYPRL